jgi:hypothetical protein
MTQAIGCGGANTTAAATDGRMSGMASEENEGQNISVNVPIGALAMAVALGVAAAAYLMIGRGDTDVRGTVTGSVSETASQVGRSGKGMLRKAGITALIAMIENDATRRLVVSFLKAIRNRS